MDFENELDKRYSNNNFKVIKDGDLKRIHGYAVLFNVLSEDLGGYKERILPGAFAEILKKDEDVRGLLNHDPNFVFSRTKNKTLKLTEDEKGLVVTAIPIDTVWARDMMASIEREDIDGMSFRFHAAPGGEKWTLENGVVIRTISKVDILRDVSIVTFPAYSNTKVEARYKPQIDKVRPQTANRFDGEGIYMPYKIFRKKIELKQKIGGLLK